MYRRKAAEIAAEKAYAEGKNENAREVVLNMLKRGRLTIEEIAEDTGITIVEVKELQKDLQKKIFINMLDFTTEIIRCSS